jgi:hypothetical protein
VLSGCVTPWFGTENTGPLSEVDIYKSRIVKYILDGSVRALCGSLFSAIFKNGALSVMVNTFRSALFAALMFAVPMVGRADIVYYLDTGQQGGQPSIDSADETAWYAPSLGVPSASGITFSASSASAFDASSAWEFGGGNFDMKEGSSVVADLTLSLWLGGLSGTEVDWVTWTAAQFCSFKAKGCGQFDLNAPLPIYFTSNHTETGTLTPYTLTAGDSYTVVLSSAAGTGGSTEYFIKAPDAFAVQDSNGDVLPPADAPEPGTWMTMLAGTVALLLVRRNRHSRV